jgi:hypothetical protein
LCHQILNTLFSQKVIDMVVEDDPKKTIYYDDARGWENGFVLFTTFGSVGFGNCLFKSVVAVTFQSIFHTEMHQNDVFLFF